MPASYWHAVDSSAGKAMYEIEITRLTFGCREVQDIAVLPEHVNLLHAGDGLDVQLLERALELLVVLSTSRLCFPDDLSAHGTLSTYSSARARKAKRDHFRFRRPIFAQNTRLELTDPVGRGRSLELSQFRGVHRVECWGSGLTTGGWDFGGLGRREKRN